MAEFRPFLQGDIFKLAPELVCMIDAKRPPHWIGCLAFACARTRLVPVADAPVLFRMLGDGWEGKTAIELAKIIRRQMDDPRTPRGRALELTDLELLMQVAFSEFYRRRNLTTADQFPDRNIRIVSDSPQCCLEATSLHGTIWRHQACPVLPLSTCKLPHCRCSYQIVRTSDRDRHWPGQPILGS